MGKTMTKDQWEKSKYFSRDRERKNKYNNTREEKNVQPRQCKPKEKWKPHSEIEVE